MSNQLFSQIRVTRGAKPGTGRHDVMAWGRSRRAAIIIPARPTTVVTSFRVYNRGQSPAFSTCSHHQYPRAADMKRNSSTSCLARCAEARRSIALSQTSHLPRRGPREQPGATPLDAGSIHSVVEAPTGRQIRETTATRDHVLAARWGWRSMFVARFQGRCPGLFYFAPSGQRLRTESTAAGVMSGCASR